MAAAQSVAAPPRDQLTSLDRRKCPHGVGQRSDFCGTAALPLKPDIGWRGWYVRKVPILLQKSFCTDDQKFSGL
jgi:hypothetical protein